MSEASPRGADRASRLARAAALCGTSGKVRPADRVVIEGDNQKQVVFLATALAEVDPMPF